ncbi:hypothetical protein F5X68DRAFT_198355 [Plectosphaerella plurivora]|uniref:Uncharacterized protein n=1 Tax=Plectosphaerella plurivora TaxID=936078 RepID=A0A9P8VMM9_9PEZI|nr:hypothetical protein F5X68DRAFT_198355 [Plectosphaerella plurivora]
MQLGTRRLSRDCCLLVFKRHPTTHRPLQLRGRQLHVHTSCHYRGALRRFPSDITDNRATFTTTRFFNMTTCQLNFKPDDTSYDDGAVFATIQPFLEGGDATLAETAKSIAATLPGPPDERGSDEHYSLYNLFIALAKQIPADDPALVKLVGVVEQLSQSPKTALKETTDGVEKLRTLHTLGWNLRDAFNPPFGNINPPTKAEIAGYTNLNAFMALLWSRGLIEGYDFALWQLRSAFEEDVADKEEATQLAAAAAYWAIHAGSRLRQLVLDPPKLSGPEERSLSAGDKFGGASGYSEERWAFWIKAFEARADGSDVDAKLAKRAVSILKGLEPSRW